ncbi:DUF72 domain-containing protein [Sphingomonas sp.]|uniref:DUF72 domain-containing protein n=1 Tax=Sphingomonas sp. TaxID=28214 RepID=UPI003B3A5863
MESERPVIHVGVAGWSIPSAVAGAFGSAGSHLERYATRFSAVEINSSFYRPHRRATYERWAASVPDDFRFAVKLPRTITHERRLCDCGDLLRRFADEIAGLGGKRGPVLVQLPPSLRFDHDVARAFFEEAGTVLGGPLVCEPRHASWFDGAADALLVELGFARVAADPALVPGASLPGGWRRLAYFRLHGSPDIYRSDYSPAAIGQHAATVRALVADGADVWVIFDNTTLGKAPANALALIDRLA